MNFVGSWNSYGNQTNNYFGDNTNSDTANDYMTISFSGNQAQLYGMAASSHGIAAVPVDGGAEQDVDFYASTAAGNKLLYTTPILTQGSHTLKVRVTGRKAAATCRS